MTRKKVLFICKNNSARSQMAEGLLKSLYSEYDVHSAGSNPRTINPLAIKVMEEIGIDISNNRSKSIREFNGIIFDSVITLCDGEDDTCPIFTLGKSYLHKSFQDPKAFDGTDNQKLGAFRRIRDEIRDWVKENFHDHDKI